MNIDDTRKKLFAFPPFFYGWTIVALGFITLGITFGVWYSYSVFILAVIKEFSWTRAAASSIFSVFLLSQSIMNPLTGLLQDRFGPRAVLPAGAVVLALSLVFTSRADSLMQYAIAYGVFAGVGISLLGFASHAAFLPKWFERKRGFAVGLAMSGVGFGMLFLIPLAEKSISAFGWRSSYLYMAWVVLFLVGPINLAFSRHSPESIGLKPDGDGGGEAGGHQKSSMVMQVVDKEWVQKSWTLKRAIATRRFWFLTFAFFFMSFSYQGILLHSVSAMVDKGLTKETAVYFFGILGITGSGGKILLGYLSDLYGRELINTLGAGLASIGILCLIHIESSPGVYPLLFAMLFGFGYSVAAPLLPAIIADIFLGGSFGVIFATVSIGGGIGGAAGSYVAGLLFDMFGNYTIPFITFIFALILAVVLIWLSAPRQVRRMIKRK